MPRTTLFPFGFAMILALAAVPAAAQEDPEEAGRARGGYAWGEGASGPTAVAAGPEDPLRILAWAGAGFSVRPVNNLDFSQDRMAPFYLQLGGAVFFPGRDIRHGVGLGVSTNLTQDPPAEAAPTVGPLAQWAFIPTYHLLIPLRYVLGDPTHDWLTLHGQFGIPLAVAGTRNGAELSLGVSLGVGVIFKFLAGLGVYADVHGEVYGGGPGGGTGGVTFHPIISADLGLVFDYEVLP